MCNDAKQGELELSFWKLYTCVHPHFKAAAELSAVLVMVVAVAVVVLHVVILLQFWVLRLQ